MKGVTDSSGVPCLVQQLRPVNLGSLESHLSLRNSSAVYATPDSSIHHSPCVHLTKQLLKLILLMLQLGDSVGVFVEDLLHANISANRPGVDISG